MAGVKEGSREVRTIVNLPMQSYHIMYPDNKQDVPTH